MDNEFIVDIINSYRESDSFYVMLNKKTRIPLQILLGYVTSCRGDITPLGMCYNPSIGVCTEILTTFIRVPKNSQYPSLIQQFINSQEKENDKKPDNKKSQ